MQIFYDKWNKDSNFEDADTKWKKCPYFTNRITTLEKLVDTKQIDDSNIIQEIKFASFIQILLEKWTKCGRKSNNGYLYTCDTKIQFTVELSISQGP